MAITNATRLSDFAAGIGTEGAILQIDNANQRIGIGTQLPSQMLEVAGIVTATAFYGDGSNLEGITSAGLGTAISDVDGSPGAVVYYTDDLLTVAETTTINPPASASAAYTQYRDVKLNDSVDLIIETGDDFIPDILGFGEDTTDPNAAGNGVFDEVYADVIKNKNGLGAPAFANGLTSVGIGTFSSDVSIGGTLSVTGNVSVGGTLTYEDVKNVDSVGLITARTGIKVLTGGINVTAGDSTVTQLGINDASGTLANTDAKLVVKGNDTDNHDILSCFSNTGTRGSFAIRNGSGITPSFLVGTRGGSETFGVMTNGGERLRIGAAGQIGLGGANYGTSGQVLTSQGGGAAPQWATPSAGGMVPLLSTNPTTGTEIFATTNLLTSTYKHYRLEYYYEGDSAELRLQQYVGSGYQTTDTYDYRYNVYNSNTTSITSADSNKSYMPVSSEQTRPTWQGTIDFYNPTSTTKQTTFVAKSDGWQLGIPWTIQNGNNLNAMCVCAADADGTCVAVTGIKLYSSTTNIGNAFATLYGMKTA